MFIMSKQTSLSSFFRKSAVVKNNKNEMTETNSNKQEIEIDEKPRKKVKILINCTYIHYEFTYINAYKYICHNVLFAVLY